MSEQGYIYLDRKICDHWLWNIKPFSKGQAWVDLILMANHKDAKIPFDGRPVLVKRGSCITSIRKLAEKWGWKRDKVAEFLNVMEEDGMIRRDSNSRRTLITIENYCIYQKKSNRPFKKSDSPGATHGATMGASPGATMGAQTTNDKLMTTNDKEIEPAAYNPFASVGEIDGNI